MQCPSCGALHESGAERCPICEPFLKSQHTPYETLKSNASVTRDTPENSTSHSNPRRRSTSKLIAFPGVSRASVPQWRKELSERVREVQERRAREAALEAADAEPQEKKDFINEAPLLELLPQTDVAPLNPLVTAALRRIERAHAVQGGSRVASSPGGAALAYVTENDYQLEAASEFELSEAPVAKVDSQQLDCPPESIPHEPEKVRNLVVVPPSAPPDDGEIPKPRPRRMIADNDPALNYLDSVPTSVCVEVVKYRHASAFARVLGAVVDLVVIALLCSPFALLVELTNGNWKDPKVIIVAAVFFAVLSFLYFTVSTALTGRTFGLRLFSLRIVDARTGLIPTGKQSAGRALVYLGTILTLGLASLYMFLDRDKQTAHDRLTRTTVITV
jgi:uncharacterized RDD family membrane protein YckC